jgi:hypothetical protein
MFWRYVVLEAMGPVYGEGLLAASYHVGWHYMEDRQREGMCRGGPLL